MDRSSNLQFVSSVFAFGAVGIAAWFISGQQSALNEREQWMAEHYVADVKASRDRYTMRSHDKWASEFAAKNGLIPVEAMKTPPTPFPKPPVSDKTWEWIQEQLKDESTN